MKTTLCSGLVICAVAVSANTYAEPKNEVVNQLALGCYSIQSPHNGTFLTKYDKGGPVNDGLSYRFEAVPIADAERFYMKPTSFTNYFLTDREGRFLASHLPAQIGAGRYVGSFAEWSISSTEIANEQRFGLYNKALNMGLRHNWQDGGLYFFDLLNPRHKTSEREFLLVEQTGCKAFPEVEVNVTGDRTALAGDVNKPIRGYVDPHTHITSYEFMGGKMMHGKPFHPWGVEEALKDSAEAHGPDGSLDIIGNLLAFNDITHRYDTRGWPDFPFWPNHKEMSHMGYYYKWIERAYLSGLRLMVSHLVENEVLCHIQSTVNPGSWINPNSCNTMDSIRLQIQRLNEMQDYIDAQSGGVGKGFFRLVTSPSEARQVIAEGKMAVVMGVEASETLNCGKKDICNLETIEAGLNELYDLGVRIVYPTHKFDNQLAGSRVEHEFINIGQLLSTGYFFETKECDADTGTDKHFYPGFPLIGQLPFIKPILDAAGLNPQYDESILHCNQHGLSTLGEYLVNRMIDKKMLIEMDHMSPDTATAVMDIVEQRQYSGVISSHSWMNTSRGGGLHPNTKRLIHAGGFVGPYNGDAYQMQIMVSRYLDELEKTSYLAGVGIGTDMNGLGTQPGPRFDVSTNPLNYPYVSEFGLVFDKQVSGNRVFDFNQEGMAHYGMLADHIQDMREQGSARVYEAVMNSAEAYIQMWERSEANNSEPYIEAVKVSTTEQSTEFLLSPRFTKEVPIY
ncbi:dipeptidase [Vibrio sp. Of14-4]|uniref:membrane dipeptidase n=1 Tax=Vibrio sp. Of14-4 TaxID=2724878 RepID=UPI001EF3B32B|nr:membrane dipeptidase [Vibrio sp. Of14-4]MCG7488250.1 dipeptidase [Vibrio sp. Of14-4]